MFKIAHIIHPVEAVKPSDLVVAQPITFETMSIAKKYARDQVEVELYAIQYHDEERIPLPGSFIRLPDITRSSLDLEELKSNRKLAHIIDILNPLYHASDADYFIYTNVDIAVLPYFYAVLDNIAAQGYDGFIVNRRTISDRYSQIHEIPLMYAEVGDIHPGSDCFVFKRENFRKLLLGETIIGTEFIGLTLRTNLAVFSNKFEHFRDLHLTFHIGDQRVWTQFPDGGYYNQAELENIFKQMLDMDQVPQPDNLRFMYNHFQRRKQVLKNRNPNKDK